MTSAELLENFKETRTYVQTIKSESNEYFQLFKKPLPFLPTFLLLGIWLFVVFHQGWAKPFMDFLDTLIFDPFVAPLDLPHTVNALLVSTAVVFEFAGPVLLLTGLINKLVLKSRLTAKAKRIAEIQSNIERDIRLLSNSVLPEDYWKVSIIEQLEKYILNQRASTLKEAVNLYEQDKKHEEIVGRIEAAEAQAAAAQADAAKARSAAASARQEAANLQSEVDRYR